MTTATKSAAGINPTQLVQDDFYHHLFKPFLLPEAAAALLGFSAKHIIRLARDRELRGFNLAVKIEDDAADMDERDPRSMIRIQARSVAMLRQPELFGKIKMSALDLQGDLIHRRESFSIWEVRHTLDCSENHVRRLLAEKLLRGKSLSVVSDRQHVLSTSLLTFLQSREL